MFDFFKKEKDVSTTELTARLWEFCLDISGQFQGEVIPSLENAGLKLSKEEKEIAVLEVPKLNLWIISKVLQSDKTVLDKLCHVYADVMERYLKQIGAPKTQLQLIDELIETYKIYYANWDNESGGMQITLTTEILQHIFNNGKSDEKFMNFFATSIVNEYVLKAMGATLDLRKKLKVTD